jgi:hypothetical protein
MSNNLPPLRRDDSIDVDNGSIFLNTVVEPFGHDTTSKSKEYAKASKNRNNHQIQSISHAIVPSDNKRRNNNFFKANTDDLVHEASFQDPNDHKIVTMGYFDKNDSGFASPSQANTTSRYNDNRVMNSVEFPMLNKTNYTETLYSLKSQSNTSPHDRIMQTIERRKRKKGATKSMAENDSNNIKSQELAVYKDVKNKPSIKQRGHKRNHEATNQKQFYEITTIEEDDESHSSTNYHNLGLSKKHAMERYNNANADLNTIEPPTKPSKGGYASMKPRGLSVRNNKTNPPIETSTNKNHFQKQKGSIPDGHGATSFDDEEQRQKSLQ